MYTHTRCPRLKVQPKMIYQFIAFPTAKTRAVPHNLFTAQETHEGLSLLNYGLTIQKYGVNDCLQTTQKKMSFHPRNFYCFMNHSLGSLKWSKCGALKSLASPRNNNDCDLDHFRFTLTSEPLSWLTLILEFNLRQNDWTSQQVQLLRADHPSGAAHLWRLRQCVAHRFPGAQVASAGSGKNRRKNHGKQKERWFFWTWNGSVKHMGNGDMILILVEYTYNQIWPTTVE